MDTSKESKQKNAPARPVAAKPATAPTAAAPAATPPPKVPPLFRRIDWFALLIAFAVVGIIYFLTLAPEETLEDSGELCTGSFYAGIPHPPGYPFWAIYSWLWTKLLVVGNVAWRVEVGEAAAAAMACGLVALMVSRGSSMLMEGIEELKNLTGKWESAICLVSGVVAGLMLGLGGVMWSESVAINRISLFGVPWVMLVMVCLLRWIYAPHQRRYLYWAWFFFGICATIHQTLLCAAMGIEFAICYVQPKLGRNLLFGNVMVYLGVLGLEQVGISSMLNTALMVLILFHSVGIASAAGYVYLVLTSKEDITRPLRDAGMLVLVGVTALCFFTAFKYSVALFAVDAGLLWLLVYLAKRTKAMGWEWLVAIVLGVLWAAGASFYFYEAIAGMTNPPMEWGYPRTVEGFFHALSRGQYERASPSNFFADPLHFLLQTGMLISDVIHEYNWVCLFVALVPLMFYFKMRKREKSWMLAIVAMYFCIGLLLLVLMNPQPDKQSADLNRVFFTSSHALIAIMIGYGFALTAAYLATHYQQFRKAALMLGIVAVAPGLIAFYNGISNTFYGDLGLTPYPYILLIFFLIAGGLVLTALASQRLIRMSDPTVADRESEQIFFYGFALAAAILLLVSLWLVFFRNWGDATTRSLSFHQISSALGRIFAPGQYNLPAIAGLLVLGIVVVFLGSLGTYRQRAPLAITLGLFALMPISSALSHWAGSEQRNHWFGYWFGHDMFTPPVAGPDGKMTYDPKVRAQMMNTTNRDLVYPEMDRNTILFGGTDPGRFNPTYMIFCDSFLSSNCLPAMDPNYDRRDVYLITQNALADGTYLEYLRAQYFRSRQIDPPFFSELARFALKDSDYQTNLLAKMVSPLDWYFESRGAHIERRWRTSTSWFTGADFTNLKDLTGKLRAHQDPLSNWLYENLSKETQDLITGSGDETRVRESLAKDLNALLDRELKQKEAIAAKQREKDAVDQRVFAGDSSMKSEQEALAQKIAALKVQPLYEPARFAQVNISDYLKAFIAQDPQSDTRIRLNRLLLEEAYPGDMAKSLGGVYPDREIYIPSAEDSQQAFSDYMKDAEQRINHDREFPTEQKQVKPGEDVSIDPASGRVSVSGQIAVMSINGLLTKVIFDHNPNNEFYVEESFPLDWMYPNLTPYGIIMKINRHELPEITDEICRRDHEFWSKYSERLIGNWITYDTPVKKVAEFAEQVYLNHNYTNFTGDRAFIRDESAQKAFSKLRSSIGGIYSWRLGLSPSGGPVPPQYLPKSQAERTRMEREADFAYKQAFAFCPYSPEAVFRYVNLLMTVRRFKDALLVVQTCQKLDPYNGQIAGLVANIENIVNSQPPQASLDQETDLTSLQNEIHANPTNFQKQFDLFSRYMQSGQQDAAMQVIDGIINNPQVTVEALLSVVDISKKLNQPPRLEAARQRLAQRQADLEAILANPKADIARVISVATAYSELGNQQKVTAALEKLTKLAPDSPEAWYDLAASKAVLHQTNEALNDLRKSLGLNGKRVGQNPKPTDLRQTAAADIRFADYRSMAEFQKLLAH